MNVIDEKQRDTTSDIEKKSCENECKSTGSRWSKLCPDCGKPQYYSRKDHWKLAVESNSKCAVCAHISYPISNTYTKSCPSCGGDMTYNDRDTFNASVKANRKCRRCVRLGTHASPETCKKLSAIHSQYRHSEAVKQKMRGSGNGMYGIHRYDKLNPFYGKQHDEEARRKMRIAACLRVLSIQRANNGRVNNVGKREGAFFSKLEQEKGWNGVYFAKCRTQHFVDHAGYFVDYYEPFYNIVVEYDEPRHYKNGMLKEKDFQRMEKIHEHLGCQFWRYDAYRGNLTRYF